MSYLAPSIPGGLFTRQASSASTICAAARWAYNDRNSRSGWFSMIERLGEAFFSRTLHSGSHLRSIEMVRSGTADAAAIDSNVLRTQRPDDVVVLGSWGPFAIQPTIMPAAAEQSVKSRVANALLTLHERHSLAPFGFQRFVEADDTLYEGNA